MKVAEQMQDVEMINISNVQQFSIKASPKAFEILSASIYENKIKAIIRELSTNALDAQVDAGITDTAFDVHLPTIFNPQFFIRDYGTGISHENVLKIYTTYFESTKTHSDEFEGCLGLGSKTPFAYTDSFNITSFFGGMKRIYTAFRDENFLPNITEVFSESSAEPSGLKVEFSVLKGDLEEFANEAKEVYKFFSLKPNFVGKSITIPEVNLDPVASYTENLKVYESFQANGYARHQGTLSIILGNICYPVPRDNFEDLMSETARKIFQSSTAFFIRVPIGTLKFTPSRERLDISKKNAAAISDLVMNTIINPINQQIAQEFQSITEIIPLKMKIAHFKKHHPLRHIFLPETFIALDLFRQRNIASPTLHIPSNYMARIGLELRYRRTRHHTKHIRNVYSCSKSSHQGSYQSEHRINMEAFDEVVVWINDEKKYNSRKVSFHFPVSSYEDDGRLVFVITDITNMKTVELFLKHHVSGARIVYGSKMAAPTSAASGRASIKGKEFVRLIDSLSVPTPISNYRTELDPDEKFYYVEYSKPPGHSQYRLSLPSFLRNTISNPIALIRHLLQDPFANIVACSPKIFSRLKSTPQDHIPQAIALVDALQEKMLNISLKETNALGAMRYFSWTSTSYVNGKMEWQSGYDPIFTQAKVWNSFISTFGYRSEVLNRMTMVKNCVVDVMPTKSLFEIFTQKKELLHHMDIPLPSNHLLDLSSIDAELDAEMQRVAPGIFRLSQTLDRESLIRILIQNQSELAHLVIRESL